MKNFIFVFVFLATLFMANASPLYKRSTTFNPCPLSGVPTLIVTISPDPISSQSTASFSVFGTLDNDVTPGTTELAIGFADKTGQKLLSDIYYQTFTKPFKAGDTVTIVAQNVPTPDDLPGVYTIGVGIGDPAPGGGPLAPLTFYGCTYAVVGAGSSTASFPIASIVA